MRIIGGRFKGVALAPLGKGDAQAHLRPTSDRVRESLFNVLAHGDYPGLEGARVLDLFAGTGALGFEALSRGAAQVLFVDDGGTARALIRRNTDILQCVGQARLCRRNATALGENTGAPYTLIFLDPPYGKGLGPRALGSARAGGWVAPGAVVVWEEGSDQPVPAGFTLRDRRKFGDTVVTILTAD